MLRLCSHQKCVRFSKNHKTAEWQTDREYGLVFSENPLQPGEIFMFEVTKSGVRGIATPFVKVGVTPIDPNTWTSRTTRKCQGTFLMSTKTGGTWIHGKEAGKCGGWKYTSTHKLSDSDSISLNLTEERTLGLRLNRTEISPVFEDLPDCPLWVVVEMHVKRIKLVEPELPSVTTISDVGIFQGKLAVFETFVSGKPVPKVEWFLDSRRQGVSPRITVTCAGRRHKMTIKRAKITDSGTVKARATNLAGSRMTTAELSVKEEYESPGMTPLTQSPHVVTEETEVVFSTDVTGRPRPDVQWFINDEPVKPSSRIVTDVHESSHILTIQRLRKGSYVVRAKAENQHSQATEEANLTVKEFTMSPNLSRIDNREIDIGESVTFVTMVTGIPQPKVLWSFGHALARNTGRYTVRCQDNTCTFKISRCTRDDSGLIIARARNEAGVHAVCATLKVNAPSVDRAPDVQEDDTPRFPIDLEDAPVKWKVFSSLRDELGLADVIPSVNDFFQVIRPELLSSKTYLTNKARKGKALIISIPRFNVSWLNPLPGYDVDCQALEELLDKTGFDVLIPYTDKTRRLTANEIRNAVVGFRGKLTTDDQMAIVCILSHGDDRVIYGCDGRRVGIVDLMHELDNVNCKKMATKPKMFIVQACQGERIDEGTLTSRTHDMAAVSEDYLPLISDTLVAYSSMPGFGSFVNIERGSIFIQEFVEVFSKHAADKELAVLLTMVNDRVSHRPVEYPRGGIGPNVNHLQMPRFESSLRKLLYLLPCEHGKHGNDWEVHH